MATTDVINHDAGAMGQPVFAAVPAWSETVSSDGPTSNTTTAPFVTVCAVSGGVRVGITGETHTYTVLDGADITFGPVKPGQTVTVAAI